MGIFRSKNNLFFSDPELADRPGRSTARSTATNREQPALSRSAVRSTGSRGSQRARIRARRSTAIVDRLYCLVDRPVDRPSLAELVQVQKNM